MMRIRGLCMMLAIAVSTAPAQAQYFPGRYPGGLDRSPSDWNRRGPPDRDSREGRVDAEVFEAPDGGNALGHGRIIVASIPGGTIDANDEPVYEAALVDRLVKAGYDTMTRASEGGQVAEIRVFRSVAVPAEVKHNPVSGAMSVGVSNRGSMTDLAVGVDLTKPKKALVSTRLEARIRNGVDNTPLWEGRATIITREGDPHWTELDISRKLTDALFQKFRAQPARTGPSH